MMPAFERELRELLDNIDGVAAQPVPAAPDDVLMSLIKRVGVLIVTVHAHGTPVGAQIENLREEVQRWARAHAKSGYPSFCLLFIFEFAEKIPKM